MSARNDERNGVACGKLRMAVDSSNPDADLRMLRNLEFAARPEACFNLTLSLQGYFPPLICNILLYHLLMDHIGAPLAIVVAILSGILFYRYRQNFAGLFVQKAA